MSNSEKYLDDLLDSIQNVTMEEPVIEEEPGIEEEPAIEEEPVID